MEAPVINVGIMTHKAISFVFNEEYVHTETGTFTIGEQRALWVNGKIVYNGEALSGAILRADQPAILFRLEGGHDRRGFSLATTGGSTLQGSVEPRGDR